MKRFSVILDYLSLIHLPRLKQTKRYIIFRLLTGVFLCFMFLGETKAQIPDVPYIPTPEDVVKKMLDIATVGPGDYLIDLGSGDGRIVIEAAKRGAYGHGIEIDSELVEKANHNAIKEGVQDKVAFIDANIFNTDFSRADVITLYLLNSINMILRPALLKNLKPGSRVVSHRFNMNAWKPDKQIKAGKYDISLWIIPANVDGHWMWKLKDKEFVVDIDQQFQEITADIFLDHMHLNVENCKLIGNKIWFSVIDTLNTIRYVYVGTVDGDTISGKLQVHAINSSTIKNWTAFRNKNNDEPDNQLLLRNDR